MDSRTRKKVVIKTMKIAIIKVFLIPHKSNLNLLNLTYNFYIDNFFIRQTVARKKIKKKQKNLWTEEEKILNFVDSQNITLA